MNLANKVYECVLQGEVSVKEWPLFLERLNGLIGNEVTKEEFIYREYVFRFDHLCPAFQANPNVPQSEFRAREYLLGTSLVKSFSPDITDSSASKWELRYSGNWDRKKPTPYHNQIAVYSSENVRQFLLAIGFREAFRYMRGGTRWQLSNGIILESSKVKKLSPSDDQDPYDSSNLSSIPVDELLIEISALTTDNDMDATSEAMQRFSVDLEPYFVERVVETKDVLHSTATLAAETRRA